MREYLNRNGTYKSYYEYEKVDGTIVKLPIVIYDPIRIDKAKAFFNITNPKGVI